MGVKDKISGFFSGIRRFFQRFWRRRHTISDLVKHKHRFVVLDTDTYKEKVSFQLSGINVFVFFGITALVLVFLTALLLAFTPLRELIPGYSNAKITEMTYENARIVDSLETQLRAQEAMLADIQDVMLGKDPSLRHQKKLPTITQTPATEGKTPYTHSREDTLLRNEIVRLGGDRNYAKPLDGNVVKSFNSRGGHYGTLMAGKAGDQVLSVQNGTVVYADKDKEGTYTVIVQHSSSELAVYKAPGKLLKESGEFVQAGEPLLQMRPLQKKETPQLFFELIREGDPINAEKEIGFDKNKKK